MRAVVGQRPDAREQRQEVCLRISECKLDGLRRRGRLPPDDGRLELEKRGDEFLPVVQGRALDEPSLKGDERVAEQPRLALQQTHERPQVTLPDRSGYRGAMAAPR